MTIKAGDTEITLYSFSGKVMSTTKYLETRIHGGGGGIHCNGHGSTAPVNPSSAKTIHDKLIVKGADGLQKGLQLRGFNLNCGQGNRITTIWGIKKGKKEGPYIAVHNHSTSETFYQEVELKKLFVFSRKEMMIRTGIVFACIGLLIGLSTGGLGTGIIYTFYSVLAGSVLGFLLQVTNKKAIERFKEELNFKA